MKTVFVMMAESCFVLIDVTLIKCVMKMCVCKRLHFFHWDNDKRLVHLLECWWIFVTSGRRGLLSSTGDGQ